jgi:aminoglycoside phosphotransferase (APT) family kinase protein
VDVIRLDGLERLGVGREAEVFALGADRVLRLARRADLAPALDREHAALVAAGHAGAPVPAVFDRVEVEGRPGLVVERLGTRNLLLEIGARPWRVLGIARVLGELHARLHTVVAPDELPPVADLVRARLESPLVPDGVRERALQALDALPRGDRLLHGDFHPANVLLRPASGAPVVIDWTGGCRGGPAADVARSELIMRFGAVGPDATAMVRALATVGRRLLVSGYLRSYARNAEVRVDSEAWTPVIAAARLAEDIEGERDTLLRLVDARLPA